MTNRLFLLALTLCLLLPALGGYAQAAASETDAFLPDFTLSGDGAADMVAIALAQEGRTGREFGYDDQWCAYFVSDCARIAGQTGAIPAHGTCTYLYQNLLNAGGKVTTQDPRPGDICFINWNGESRMRHVEIVYRVENGMVYTVGGNSGQGSSYRERQVKCHAPLEWEVVLAIVRPNYGTASQPEPVKPQPKPEPEPPRTYAITYDAKGGTGAPEQQTKVHAEALKLSDTVPVRPGYRFVDWYRSGGKRYEAGCQFSRNANTCLYAKWVKDVRERLPFTAITGAGGPAEKAPWQLCPAGTDILY